MKRVFKCMIISVLLWQTLQCDSDVYLINNTPLTLKFNIEGVSGLKKNKNYKVTRKKTIAPFSREMILEINRHKLPSKVFKKRLYTFKTIVTAYDKTGKQVGSPVVLWQTITKLSTALTVSKMKYGINGRQCNKLHKLKNWKVDGRFVDVYCGDFLKLGKTFHDVEYAFGLRPFTGAKFDTNPNVLRVLQWNLWMRPLPGLPLDGQVARAKMIPKIISGMFREKKPDVVAFNELFEPLSYKQIKKRMKAEGYPYSTKVLGGDAKTFAKRLFKKRNVSNSGVAFFSRWPIIKTAGKFYDVCKAGDCLASKGVVYICINKNGKKYHIFATHVQSDAEGGYETKTRAKQFKTVSNFITKQNIPKTEPVIIVGDFNVDKYRYKPEYASMLKILNAVHPDHTSNVQYPGITDKMTQWNQNFLDYVLFDEAYLNPKKSYNKPLMEFTQESWLPKKLRTRHFKKGHWPSDHWPVLGVFYFQ